MPGAVCVCALMEDEILLKFFALKSIARRKFLNFNNTKIIYRIDYSTVHYSLYIRLRSKRLTKFNAHISRK